MAKNDFTTLISIRVDNDTLKAIEKFCENRGYFNRSSIINQALKKVFVYHEYYDIYDFLYNGKELK